MRSLRIRSWAIVIAIALTMAACGGKGDDGSVDTPAAGEELTQNEGKDGKKSADKKERGKDAARRGDKGKRSEGTTGSATGADGSGNATNKATGTGDSPAARQAAASPLGAGTYQYDTDGKTTLSGGNTQQIPDVTTLVVEKADGSQQYSKRDLRDSQGNGTLTETILSYDRDGVRLEWLKITNRFGGGLTDVREFRPDPPVMLAPTGAEPGDRWEFTLKGSGTTVQVQVQIERAERVKIGGRAVETFVVRTHATFTGAVEGEQNSVAWISPSNLLTVKEQVTTDVRNGPIQAHTEYEATLKSLSPS